MCSPQVAAAVREAIRERGGQMDRRRLLAGGAATLAGAALAPAVGTAQEASPVATPATAGGGAPVVDVIYSSSVPISRIYDLTHVLSPDFPVFAGDDPMEIEQTKSIDQDGYLKYWLSLDEHTGTHVDAPAHFIPDGVTAENIDPSFFFAPLCVIDISERAANEPDAAVTDGDIAEWEAIHGTIPDRAFVAMCSGWESRLSDPASYVNLDADGVQHYPGWSGQAVAFLTGERTVVGIGVDTLSLDPGPSTDFLAHINALQAGLYGIENLANLGAVPPSGTMLVVGAPKHRGASGGPARVFAVEFGP
ncbi:MAG TPA: cyclase family protein [Thermomicrobiales bacterium]|nr:cyclase family protein [Thermomicrobiales bacterium]